VATADIKRLEFSIPEILAVDFSKPHFLPMTDEERNQRAWVLRTMRVHSRAPHWLSDSIILAALELQSIRRPNKVTRKNDRLLCRVQADCLAG